MKRALAAFLIAPLFGACFLGGNPGNGGTPDGGTTDGNTVLPFSADSPFVYVSKVKNLLTGVAVTQTEVDSVVNAPDANKQAVLKSLIDTWMTYPEYTSKMMTFFEQAFQQTQISTADFAMLIPNQGSIGTSPQTDLLIQNVKEMFARTVLQMIADNQPLSAAFTTNTFMMTPPLMELVAFLDWNQTDNNDNLVDQFKATYPSTNIVVQDTDSTVTYAQTVDPTNKNFMNWYYPGVGTVQPNLQGGGTNPVCTADSRTYNPSGHVVHFLMYGQLDVLRFQKGASGACAIYAGNNNSIFTNDDFAETAWKPVTIRKPNKGEATTNFWDATYLRNNATLVLNTPRVGFYSTPAFQANWPTNTSNVMRVTINQSFIVGLGAQVDGTDPTNPGLNPPGLDQEHAQAGPACLGCHQILDPSRAILQATYSYGYGIQTDGGLISQPGEFVFNGVIQPYKTISDLGTQLAAHVMYPGAWAQKLCFYANSQACDPSDTEFQNIVSDFKNGGQWKTLVEDIFSSPITTNAVATMTATTEGELVSVARRDHLCTLINARLGLTDACGLDIVTTKNLTGIPQIAAGLPSDGYGRGAPIPVLPAQPTLFFRAGIENICEDVANEIIDATNPPVGAKTYSSASQATVDAAIADFVGNLMGLTPDNPAASQMSSLLQANYTGVLGLGVGAKPTDALKSTFIVACESPVVAAIGM
jgi:hypothetical protein